MGRGVGTSRLFIVPSSQKEINKNNKDNVHQNFNAFFEKKREKNKSMSEE